MNQKILAVVVIVILLFFGVYFFRVFKPKVSSPLPTNSISDTTTPGDEVTVIRSFMAQPNLALTFVNTDLPMPYFRVGKVTKMGSGENMEKVDSWVRQVNVYGQKELLNGTCSIYEYHTEARNHTLTAVMIRGLRQNEIDNLKQSGTTCVSNSGTTTKITKVEAETIAMDYLKRAIPNLDQIKDKFTYSLQSNGETHEWLWEDKNYKLPEGLESRPYYYPIIRISVNSDKTISYWNTVSLFQN